MENNRGVEEIVADMAYIVSHISKLFDIVVFVDDRFVPCGSADSRYLFSIVNELIAMPLEKPIDLDLKLLLEILATYVIEYYMTID